MRKRMLCGTLATALVMTAAGVRGGSPGAGSAA